MTGMLHDGVVTSNLNATCPAAKNYENMFILVDKLDIFEFFLSQKIVVKKRSRGATMALGHYRALS